MSVIITNGQSWEQIAEDFTLSKEYGTALAIQNNMDGESITGKKFRIEIPDNWMKAEYSGKQISLPASGSASGQWIAGIPNWVILALGAGAVVLFLGSR